MNSLGSLEDIEEIGEGQVTGKYFHFQIEKENQSHKLKVGKLGGNSGGVSRWEHQDGT